jgi:hypothetical protein
MWPWRHIVRSGRNERAALASWCFSANLSVHMSMHPFAFSLCGVGFRYMSTLVTLRVYVCLYIHTVGEILIIVSLYICGWSNSLLCVLIDCSIKVYFHVQTSFISMCHCVIHGQQLREFLGCSRHPNINIASSPPSQKASEMPGFPA